MRCCISDKHDNMSKWQPFATYVSSLTITEWNMGIVTVWGEKRIVCLLVPCVKHLWNNVQINTQWKLLIMISVFFTVFLDKNLILLRMTECFIVINPFIRLRFPYSAITSLLLLKRASRWRRISNLKVVAMVTSEGSSELSLNSIKEAMYMYTPIDDDFAPWIMPICKYNVAWLWTVVLKTWHFCVL